MLLTLVTAGCGGSSGSAGTGGGDGGTAVNVLPVSVNGTHCAADSYPDKACVSVTVCLPDQSACQVVDDILLDTGSSGLRIFRQALTLSLPTAAAGTGQLGECITFGDGTADWGPVATARVVLGGEPAVLVPVHVIDASFALPPSSCGTPERSPQDAGLNGILGVSTFAQDCGSGCTSDARNGIYFSCTGTSCAGTSVPLPQQVMNPIVLLPQDGNGYRLTLPPLPQGHATSLEGELVLGIATRANNAPAAATTYLLDANGEFTTTLAGQAYPSSFLDTGSNGYFFAAPSGTSLPPCGSPNQAWYCPASLTSFQATNAGTSGVAGPPVRFQIENFDAFSQVPEAVSAYIGGPAPANAGFDWGLPFFLGRTVYVGMEGASSPLGRGMYWAY